MEIQNVLIVAVIINMALLISFVAGFWLRGEAHKEKSNRMVKQPIEPFRMPVPKPVQPMAPSKIDMSSPFVSQEKEDTYECRMKDFKESDMFVPQVPQKGKYDKWEIL